MGERGSERERAMNSDLEAAMNAATIFTRKTALLIAKVPQEKRAAAYHVAQRRLTAAIRPKWANPTSRTT
jgi:hypothetical protein